jgi:hypothetical protein
MGLKRVLLGLVALAISAVMSCEEARNAAGPGMDSHSGRFPSVPDPKAGAPEWQLLALRHIGPQDRGVPSLLLHVRGVTEREVAALSQCGRSAECHALEPAAFERLTNQLASEFFTNPESDKDLTRVGTYEFRLEGPNAQRVLKLGPANACRFLARAIELTDGKVRDRLKRQRDLCQS